MATSVASAVNAPGAPPEPTHRDHTAGVGLALFLAGGLALAGVVAWQMTQGATGPAPQPTPPAPPWGPPPPPVPPPQPPPPQPPAAPSCSGSYVTVQAGDTLSGLAYAYCGNANRWPDLCASSGLSNCGWLSIGQRVCIPAGCLPAPPPSGLPPGPPAPPCNPVFGFTC